MKAKGNVSVPIPFFSTLSLRPTLTLNELTITFCSHSISRSRLTAETLQIPSALSWVLLVMAEVSALASVGHHCFLLWAHCYPVIVHPSPSLYLYIHAMCWIIHGVGEATSVILIRKTYSFSCMCSALPQVLCLPYVLHPISTHGTKMLATLTRTPFSHGFLLLSSILACCPFASGICLWGQESDPLFLSQTSPFHPGGS